MKKTSMDIAERKGGAFRRVLRSAERLSDAAIRRGSDHVKTPGSRSIASLSRMTRPDQRRLAGGRLAHLVAAFFRVFLVVLMAHHLLLERPGRNAVRAAALGLRDSSARYGTATPDTGKMPAVPGNQDSNMHRIVLCADDYGLSAGVSRGIRELLALGRLSATSCMVVYPEFESEGPALHPYFEKSDIGLHFTLTKDRPVGAVMSAAYAGRLDQPAIANELDRQLATFSRVMNRAPDYIDGHQHVHLLPGVREAVASAAKRIGAYVRSTVEPINLSMGSRPSPIEAAFLSWTARPLDRLLRDLKLSTNRGFRGVRTFRERETYRNLFRKMIAGAKERCLVMCHPGIADVGLAERDSVTRAREDELRYLASDVLPGDLLEVGLTLSRLRATLTEDSWLPGPDSNQRPSG